MMDLLTRLSSAYLDNSCPDDDLENATKWLMGQVCVCSSVLVLSSVMKTLPPLMTLLCTAVLSLDCDSIILSTLDARRLGPLAAPSLQRILIIAGEDRLENNMTGLRGRRVVAIDCSAKVAYFKTEFEPRLKHVPLLELPQNLPMDTIDIKRDVILATFNCTIFSMLGPLSEDGHPVWYDGLELKAVATILESRGLRWRVIIPWRNYGEVYPNGTIQRGGVKSFMAEALADIALCSIWITPSVLKTIRPSDNDRFRLSSRILVPQPQASVTHWHSFFMTLPLSFWCIHIVSALASAIVIHLSEVNLNYPGVWGIKFGTSLYVAFTICFQGQHNGKFTRFGSRVLQLCWAILVVIASSIFSSFLVARLTNPLLPDPVDSLEDMVRLGYKWTSGFGYVPADNAGSYFDMRGEIERKWFKTQVSREEIVEGKTCIYVFELENMFFVDEPHLYKQEFLSALVPSSRYLAQNLISILTRRLSSYSNILSAGLGRLHESGIYLRINNEILRSSRMRKFVIIHSEVNQPLGGTPLSLVQLRGTFYLLLVGLFISTICFLLELLNRNGIRILKR